MCAAGAAALSGMYTNLLLHAGRLQLIVPAGLGAALLAIALNAALVPRFDVFGACAAVLAANLLLLFVYRHAVQHGRDSAPTQVPG
jgi:O-antigen/teichoic acid export membrane protein